jgi:hypothetical protein
LKEKGIYLKIVEENEEKGKFREKGCGCKGRE